MIRANTKIIPESAFIHESTIIECDHFEVGENTYIGPNNKITCKKFVAGDYFYMTERVDVGRGGCTGPNSEVIIGKNVGVFEDVVINPSEKVTIGDNVGIGTGCLLWTHGAWLDITQGYPADFGPISIGDNVWFPARSIMMPNTNIGSDCVIASGAIVTRDIPSGSLAMGAPCKVVRENFYPKPDHEVGAQLDEIMRVWYDELLPHKRINRDVVTIERFKNLITLTDGDNYTSFHTENKTMSGDVTALSEDLRDFLRRRGVKIYTGAKFKSIPPYYVQKILS